MFAFVPAGPAGPVAPAIPSAPRGIVKFKTTSLDVPEFVTAAFVPASDVVTVGATVIVAAASPLGPVNPVSPVAPVNPVSPRGIVKFIV